MDYLHRMAPAPYMAYSPAGRTRAIPAGADARVGVGASGVVVLVRVEPA